jgi:Mn-dependent DtxR family transcriptional regulator
VPLLKAKVTIDLYTLAKELSASRRYVSINYLARRLAISEKTAGKVLSKLERMGMARRYSNKAYEISYPFNEE